MNDILIEILGGLIVGASLGLVGAGGAVMSVPIFDVLLAHQTKESVVEALVVTSAVAFSAALRAALKRCVDWPRVALVGVPGMLGAYVGGRGAHYLSDQVQMGIFATVALIAAWRMFASADETAPKEMPTGRPSRAAMVEAVAIGIGLGLLTGLVGVGGGFLLVPALVLLMKLPMRVAVGTSLSIIALNCAVGYMGNRLGSTEELSIAWKAVAVVGLCGILGSWVGAHYSARLPRAALHRIFAVVICMAALAIVATQLWPQS